MEDIGKSNCLYHWNRKCNLVNDLMNLQDLKSSRYKNALLLT